MLEAKVFHPKEKTHPLGKGFSRLAKDTHVPGVTGKSNQGNEPSEHLSHAR